MPLSRYLAAATIALTGLTFAPPVQAQTADKGFSDFVSGAGTVIYLGGASLLPLITDVTKGVSVVSA